MTAAEFRAWFKMSANNPRFGHYTSDEDWELDLLEAYAAHLRSENERLVCTHPWHSTAPQRLVKNKSTKENRKFWQHVEKVAREVDEAAREAAPSASPRKIVDVFDENEVLRSENERLTRERDELYRRDPYTHAEGSCCGDAHASLRAALDHIKVLGFEIEKLETKDYTEHIWRNKRAEQAEAELARLKVLLRELYEREAPHRREGNLWAQVSAALEPAAPEEGKL